MTVHCLASDNPLLHVVDHPWVKTADGRYTILSNHIIMMVVAMVVLFVVLPLAAKRRRGGDEIERYTPRGFGGFIEFICAALRDHVARPNLGEHTDRFIKYIWTAFFFILTCNILGLLPLSVLTKAAFGKSIYGTATGNIFTTGALASCTLLVVVVSGLRINGLAYIKHFFMGPFPINLLIAVLEMAGVVVKCCALAMRLFANMCAGHILLAVLLSFIAMAGANGAAMGVGIAIPVVLGSVAINLLELFVAFLQAFIFTFLTTVFIGLAVNIHHDEDHGGEDTAHAH